MINGTYQAIKDTGVVGLFSMADVLERQIVSVEDGDHENTVFVNCGPACTVEIYRDNSFSNFELID